MNFADAASYTTLLADQTALAKHNYQLIFPAAVSHQLAFAAIITKLEVNDPAADVISAQVDFQISGAITLT
jgi:hypothetical protein